MTVINESFYLDRYPDSLISALSKDRKSMVESFVDEAVRFYIILLVYPSFPVGDVMKIAQSPDRYDVTYEEMDDGRYLVCINDLGTWEVDE